MHNTRNWKRLTIGAAALALLGGTASAQGGPGDGPKMGRFTDRAFERLDSNGDGVISEDEMETRRADRFDFADDNNDGEITKEEFSSAAQRRREEMRNRRFSEADTDGSGGISLEEFTAQAAERFAEMDKNGDGQLSAEEMRPPMRRSARR